uniref:Translation initiation factor eIF-2B subunit alpha n=1 Tax=Heterorhabditis bacteriophora TaxID=37862 RepID=A0A1I7XQQ6_HETBA
MEASATDLSDLQKSFVAVFRGKSCRDSSLKIALETINFLKKVVIHEKYDTISDLLSLLSIHGHIIACAEPSELVIRNAVLMVTKLARDENTRLLVGTEPLSPYDSLNKLWMDSEKRSGAANGKKLKKGLILAVKEVLWFLYLRVKSIRKYFSHFNLSDFNCSGLSFKVKVAAEMESCRDSIAAQANDLIQPQDILIVNSLNQSSTLAAFLASARSNKKLRILSVTHSCEFDSSPDFVSPILLSDVGTKMCEVTKVLSV